MKREKEWRTIRKGKQKQKKTGGDGERAKEGETEQAKKSNFLVLGNAGRILPTATYAGGLAWMYLFVCERYNK
mgnify:CR=1 FL=1